MSLGFDPALALRTLVAHEVDFVLVGGLAANVLGSPSVTHDLDICYSREPANLERLATALRALSARLRGVDEEVPFLLDARTLAADQNFTFTTDAGALDCLGLPSGTEGYPDLTRAAKPYEMDGVLVRVVALDDLIRMKRAAGRRKDLIEVEVLLGVREALKER